MKRIFLPALTALLLTAACTSKNNKVDTVSDPATADSTATAVAEKDSTIYGTSDEFGMSTFTLISDKGDTLFLTRTSADGIDGKIYGSLAEGQRYAVTTRDKNQAIGVLINVTQLSKHAKDYKLINGHLILNGDTVSIVTLNDKELKTK